MIKIEEKNRQKNPSSWRTWSSLRYTATNLENTEVPPSEPEKNAEGSSLRGRATESALQIHQKAARNGSLLAI